MQGISVIICCFNGRKRLSPTLNSLANQIIPESLNWEIILIDNNSTDDSASFSLAEWHKFGKPTEMKVFQETKPGVAAARVRGLKCANYEFVLFCDDDNWLNNTYVARTFEALNSNSEIGAVGGYGIAIGEIDFPDWFKDYSHGYAVGKPKYESGNLPENEYLVSAGMGLRKELVLNSINILPMVLSGRDQENSLLPGEDTEICLRLLLMRKGLIYDSELFFQHFIPKERLTVAYRDAMFQAFKKTAEPINLFKMVVEISLATNFNKILTAVKSFIRLPFSYLKLVGRWDFERDVNFIYLSTGINLGKVNPKIILMKKITLLR